MKKIIILITVSILLGINFLLVPLGNIVKAEENNNVIENGIENIQDEVKYAIGSLVTASQGGEAEQENYYGNMTNLGTNILRNAVLNGKRMTDIFVQNGRELALNPFNIFEIVGNTWEDFANNEIIWINGDMVTVHLGANFHYGPNYDRDPVTVLFKNHGINFPVGYSRVIGTRLDRITTRMLITFKEDGRTGRTADGYNHRDDGYIWRNSDPIATHRGFEFTPHMTNNIAFSLDTIQVRRDLDMPLHRAHVPDEPVPTKEVIESNFSSTFKDMSPSTSYTYDLDDMQSSIINNHYVTNNYTSIVNEGDNNEGDTIIHEADGEGGGTFWGALLNLLGTLIKSVTGLASSIIEGISGLLNTLLDSLVSLIVPEDLDLSGKFDGIQNKFEVKFSGVLDISNSFTSAYSQPKNLNEIPIEIMGEEMVLFTPAMMKYINILRSIITGYIALLTVTTIYKRFVGNGDIIE